MKTFWYSFAIWMFTMGCVMAGIVMAARHNNGIYAAPSGEASLAAGEACTINASDHRSSAQIWTDMTWCMETIKMDRKLRGLP